MDASDRPQPRFDLGVRGQRRYWARRDDGGVTVLRGPVDQSGPEEPVVTLQPDTLRNLLLWAEDEKSVTFSLTGPLAKQVRDLAKELALTPEMFVWHAVKLFIETAPEP